MFNHRIEQTIMIWQSQWQFGNSRPASTRWSRTYFDAGEMLPGAITDYARIEAPIPSNQEKASATAAARVSMCKARSKSVTPSSPCNALDAVPLDCQSIWPIQIQCHNRTWTTRPDYQTVPSYGSYQSSKEKNSVRWIDSIQYFCQITNEKQCYSQIDGGKSEHLWIFKVWSSSLNLLFLKVLFVSCVLKRLTTA